MQDKILPCRECGTEFTFTVGEQEFYAQKGYTNEPGRCPNCRAMRKSMSGGAPRRAGGGGDREMFPATCAECGCETKVPFRPTQGKPVYCSDCYRKVSMR
ncbi:MAG TPA: zinc-ribbon domain containing protein [Chroococcales cyanobacterium]